MTIDEVKQLLNFPDESNWSEGKIQSRCVEWHNKTFPTERGLLFTVNNNSDTSEKGMIQTALGRVAGVSDLIYLFRGKAFCIEMKRTNGEMSKAQERWAMLVAEQGIDYVVCYSFAAFVCLIITLHEQDNGTNTVIR